jgi:Cof subfamily protein (haloacid dehalogenase superfamily)
MDIRLIAMDLDGTALQKDRNSFSPRLLRALEDAHRRGIAIAPVTGRQYGLLPDVLKQPHSWDDLAVLCNGGQVRRLRTGQQLYGVNIAADVLSALLKMADVFGLPIEFSLNSKLYLTKDSLRKQQDWQELTFHRDTILANHGCLVSSLEPLVGNNVEKVNLLCIRPEWRDAVEQELRSVSVSAVWSSSSCMEITHPEATKGNGIRHLCRLLDIPMSCVMALGDSGNDETMLRQAGLGIAMGNAPEEIRACADAVTETNLNDGAAIAIERYALN